MGCRAAANAAAHHRRLRWPWLLATLALTLMAGVLLVRTMLAGLQIGGDSDGGDYTDWVHSPLRWAYFLAAVAGVVTAIVLGQPRWRQRTRLLLFAFFAAFSLAIGFRGEHESAVRRHIAPHLVAAVDAFQSPAGATPAGPAVVSSDGAYPPNDVLGEPSASRSWKLPTDSAAAACRAVNQMIAGQHGWNPQGAAWLCEFTRQQGRVCGARISGTPLGSRAETIEVFAFPRDGWNC